MRATSAALLLTLLSLSPLRAQPRPQVEIGVVRSNIEKVYYDVEGDSPAVLAAQLGQYGPEVSGERYFGLTEWEVYTEYRWVKRRAGCSIDGLTVRVSVQTHLPRWHRSAAAPKELSGAWDRFLHALDWHEHGHRDLAEEAAEVIRARLASLHAPNCAHIEAQAHREVIVALNRYEVYNNEYDIATDYGRSQGAVWPPMP